MSMLSDGGESDHIMNAKLERLLDEDNDENYVKEGSYLDVPCEYGSSFTEPNKKKSKTLSDCQTKQPNGNFNEFFLKYENAENEKTIHEWYYKILPACEKYQFTFNNQISAFERIIEEFGHNYYHSPYN